ncbi:MAG: hypothetical protein ACJAZ3_002098 [Sphingobacteriales bacterium]|jgi:hypothetical protein
MTELETYYIKMQSLDCPKFSILLIEFADQYKATINEVLKLKNEFDEVDKFYLDILRKSIIVLSDTSELFAKVKEDEYKRISTGILLRSIISDLITLKYVLFEGNSDKGQNQLCVKVNKSQPAMTIKNLMKGLDNLDENDKKIELELINNLKSEYEINDGDITNAQYYSISEMLRSLKSKIRKDSSIKKDLFELIEAYDILSKYEHFGAITRNKILNFKNNDKVFLNELDLQLRVIHICTTLLLNFIDQSLKKMDNSKQLMIDLQLKFDAFTNIIGDISSSKS